MDSLSIYMLDEDFYVTTKAGKVIYSGDKLHTMNVLYLHGVSEEEIGAGFKDLSDNNHNYMEYGVMRSFIFSSFKENIKSLNLVEYKPKFFL